MSGKYPGLVVGGPWAGRSITNDERRLLVEEIPARSLSQPSQLEVTQHVYTWVHTGQLGLWIHSTLDLHRAILEMANAYAREQLALAEAAKSGRKAHPQGGQSPFDGTTAHID